MSPAPENAHLQIDLDALERLIALLGRRGYQVIGPTVSDGAIGYAPVRSPQDLPAGWTDEQEAGRYRLKRREDQALFGYTVGPQSWKRFLHSPEVRLLQIEREARDLRFIDGTESAPRQAFLGVRACDLAAVGVQDRVLAEDRFPDPIYQSRRREVFIVAVNCTQCAPTCFCVSMGTGPRARRGFDLALTELAGPERHVFLAESGSPAGDEVLRELGGEAAGAGLRQEADEAVERAAQQSRRMETEGLHDLLCDNFEHVQWDHVAARCLACANCTMVCPTCFCTSVEDTSDVTGAHAERWRKWDSCFTQSFSYIHGGSVRMSARARYRQWMTHKLASWIDQFGTSGCVGCGRCITWCPAGIDITAEVRAIREGAPPPTVAVMENQDGND